MVSDGARIQGQAFLIPKPVLLGLFMSLAISFSNSSSNFSVLTAVIKKNIFLPVAFLSLLKKVFALK